MYRKLLEKYVFATTQEEQEQAIQKMKKHNIWFVD